MIRPPRYKMAIVTWIAIYPLITLLLWVLTPFIQGVPVPLVTLALSAALVTLQTYVVMPLMMRLFGRWLFPRRPAEGPASS